MMQSSRGKLPVHGFVLAGGMSSRMGQDKSLMTLHGRTLAEIAVEKLRRFCETVSIAGNRDDLQHLAPVVRERRVRCGPVAGMEAGLTMTEQEWTMFIPVDVPLVPWTMLERWGRAVLVKAEIGCRSSYLLVSGERQPAFCMLHSSVLPAFHRELDSGRRSIAEVLAQIDNGTESWLWPADAGKFAPVGRPDDESMQRWFLNVNEPADMVRAGVWAELLPDLL
jgi:molybdopterin-guanine dinucleotide biosynthesis protein A